MRNRSSRVLIARQPIVDRHHAIVAYELLYRAPHEREHAVFVDNALATAALVDAAFRRMDITAAIGGARALINVDAEFLLSRRVEQLPKEHVMLEILETVEIDEQIVARCRALKNKGYQLALDDVCRYSNRFEPLLEFVDVVKIDVQQLDAASLVEIVGKLKEWPPRLLAEKVETRSLMKHCLALGVEWVQGFFCGKPMLLDA